MKHTSFVFFCVLIAFICVLAGRPCQAQQAAAASFGTVPDSLFAKQQYPSDPAVPFLYSLKKLEVHFREDDESIVAVLDYHVRVKVFDSSVPEAAVVAIPYYFENNIETVSRIQGVTHKTPNASVPLLPERVRTINVNARYNIKEFTMPEVTDGAVLEYSYRVERRYIEELPTFYFAHQVPTAQAEVSITYPQYLRYKGVIENMTGRVETFSTQLDSSNAPKIFTYPQPDPIIKQSWRARNIPAVPNEPFISSLNDYRGNIKFQLSAFGLPRQTLETSWPYVVAELRRKQHIFDNINANKQAYQQGEAIAQGVKNAAAVQDSIFRLVNKKANYSESTAPFSTVPDSVVLAGEPADQAAINQTLIAMLRGAGIEANPLLISTRESGHINPNFPSFFAFNGQLVHSRIGNSTYLMDASFAYSYPNLIPINTYNERGLLIQPQSFSWIDILPEQSAVDIALNVDAELNRNGTLAGHLTAKVKGYPAREMRAQYARGRSAEGIIRESLFEGYTQATIENIRLDGITPQSGVVSVEADVRIPNYAISYTSGLRFNRMVVGYLRENPLSEPPRVLPITLEAPEKLDLNYTISLPDGWQPQRALQANRTALGNGGLVEDYNVQEGLLRYRFRININQKTYPVAAFPQLYGLYNRWVTLSNEPWLLTND